MGLSGSTHRKNRIQVVLAAVIFAACVPGAGQAELTDSERAHIIREMMSEHGTAKILIPRSKKALDLQEGGARDEDKWEDALDKFGPAARVGDLVEITKVEFKGSRLVLELNHGIKGGRKWWHRVQVSGTRNQGTTLGSTADVYAPGGTTLAVVYDEEIPSINADDLRAILAPVLDFEQRSAAELYVEKLPEEFQVAIKEKTVRLRAWTRDMVLLAKGRPDQQSARCRTTASKQKTGFTASRQGT